MENWTTFPGPFYILLAQIFANVCGDFVKETFTFTKRKKNKWPSQVRNIFDWSYCWSVFER